MSIQHAEVITNGTPSKFLMLKRTHNLEGSFHIFPTVVDCLGLVSYFMTPIISQKKTSENKHSKRPARNMSRSVVGTEANGT